MGVLDYNLTSENISTVQLYFTGMATIALCVWIMLCSQGDNCCVSSLSQLVRWLGAKAEELGVEVYPGFAASEVQDILTALHSSVACCV